MEEYLRLAESGELTKKVKKIWDIFRECRLCPRECKIEGIISIYMPDFKYGSNKMGLRYSKVPDYWDTVRKAIKEMHRQVGDLKLNQDGIATKGLIIRHLVMPGMLEETEKILEFIATEISKDTYLNIMDQYYPYYQSHLYPEIDRPSTAKEYSQALTIAKELDLDRLAD